MESVAEIRRAARARRVATTQEKGIEVDTAAFRPVSRPPMALLCLLDDGREEGEWVRIRTDQFVIGRTEGDLNIPHDPMISSRHAAIARQADKAGFRWYLEDLQSTNGTYVRVSDSMLPHGQELLIGTRHYRFDLAPRAAPAEPADKGTRGWHSISPADLLPSLVEILAEGEGKRILLSKAEHWIGRDARQCSIVPGSDPMMSPRHARLYRDAKGRWHIENAGSRNGTWLRIHKLRLTKTGQFQLGEQRFLVRIL